MSKPCVLIYGKLRLSCVLLAYYVPKCQMSSGPYEPIFKHINAKLEPRPVLPSMSHQINRPDCQLVKRYRENAYKELQTLLL